MSREDFEKYFVPIASVKISSTERIEAMIPAYFNLLKGCHVNTWREVCLEYTQSESKARFPEPWQFKEMVNSYLFELTHKSENDYLHSDEYRKKCESPEALKARRAFYEKVAELCLEAEDEKEYSNSGVKLVHCIGEAIIAEPYEREKKAQSRMKIKNEIT